MIELPNDDNWILGDPVTLVDGKLSRPKTLEECNGAIAQVDGDVVTVALFSEENIVNVEQPQPGPSDTLP